MRCWSRGVLVALNMLQERWREAGRMHGNDDDRPWNRQLHRRCIAHAFFSFTKT